MLRRFTVVLVLCYASMYVAVEIWWLISISQAKCARLERAATSAKWRRKFAHENILFCTKFLQRFVRVFARTAIILCAMQEKRDKNKILFPKLRPIYFQSVR